MQTLKTWGINSAQDS